MAKGVDLVGWRACTKQKELGPKRFAVTLKQLGRTATLGRSIPPPPSQSMALTPEQRKRIQQNEERRQAAATFDRGTPECAACPISGGKGYGCYTAVDFPIDAVTERTLFEYFASELDNDHSISAGLYRDLVSKVPAKGTAWHTDRGPSGTLAELDKPLVKEWGFLMWKKRVDSAMLLGSLFFNQRRMGVISAFAQFWDGFLQHAHKTVEDFESSETLKQIEDLHHFYERVGELASTTDGVQIIVESDAPTPGDDNKA